MPKKKEPVAIDQPITYAYGIRTWNKDGSSHGSFRWDLTIGARTTAPDWKPVAACGNGLHANEDGWGDWALLGMDADGAGKIIGIVRWDAALTVRIDGDKSKAPWMEIVMTSQAASLASIYGFISEKWQVRAKAEKCESSATGDSGHASATGDSGHASATGDSGHASATGDRGHASATGYSGVAVSLTCGTAQAGPTGALVLTFWEFFENKYTLRKIFAAMVGETHHGLLIEANTPYRLKADGTPERV